jgi:four helix bundle protein
MFLTLEHKKFDVYKVSSQLLLECYRMSIKLPVTEKYNLIDQIRRASVSVRLNLAEGSSRKSSLERKRFYEIARGSLIEIDTAFEICVDLNYLNRDDLTNMGNLLNRAFSMITKMIYVNS